MGYLIPSDYIMQIQSDNLQQVIRSNSNIQTKAEITAIEEASSYLVQKYDLLKELQDTPAWNGTKVYKAGNRVYFNPSLYNTTISYTTGQYAVSNGNVYQSNAGNVAHAFDPTEWTLICPQYQIFNAALPAPLFNLASFYPISFAVFWKDKTYACLVATRQLSHAELIQFDQYANVPYQNIFPDDPSNGAQYWGAGTSYTVPAGTDIQNTDFWTMGDNRSQQLLTYVIDIALYHMHSAIAPKNIPDLRVKRYDDARAWLKMCAKGDVTTVVPVVQPQQGMRIRYGGNIKNKNDY